jgi:hypothetical protein
LDFFRFIREILPKRAETPARRVGRSNVRDHRSGTEIEAAEIVRVD